MAATTIAVRRQLDPHRRTAGSALTPAATTLIMVSAAAFAAWLWSRTTQPGVDAATLARLQPRQPVRQGA